MSRKAKLFEQKIKMSEICEPWGAETGINVMIHILIFVEKFLYYDAIKDFSVWQRTCFNPAILTEKIVPTVSLSDVRYK